MLADPLLRQLSRIYQRPLETPEAACDAVRADPGILASALFLEAAESDDVTSVETALAYCDARLAELAPFVGDLAPAIRERFAEKVAAWSAVG